MSSKGTRREQAFTRACIGISEHALLIGNFRRIFATPHFRCRLSTAFYKETRQTTMAISSSHDSQPALTRPLHVQVYQREGEGESSRQRCRSRRRRRCRGGTRAYASLTGFQGAPEARYDRIRRGVQPSTLARWSLRPEWSVRCPTAFISSTSTEPTTDASTNSTRARTRARGWLADDALCSAGGHGRPEAT